MLVRKFINAFHIYRTRGIVDLLHIAVHKLPKARVDLTDAVDVSNEYINWLYYANPGMLHRGNLYCIDYAIRNMPDNTPVIEIGSFSGLSTNVLSYFKTKYHITKPLITCDKWKFAGAENGGFVGDSASVTHAEYREFVKKNYMRNIRMFSRHDLPYTLEMFSDDFFTAWRQSKEAIDVLDRPIRLGGSIGFAYMETIPMNMPDGTLRTATNSWWMVDLSSLTIPPTVQSGRSVKLLLK